MFEHPEHWVSYFENIYNAVDVRYAHYLFLSVQRDFR